MRQDKIAIAVLIILTALAGMSLAATDVLYSLKSEGGDPVVNVTVELVNSTGDLIGNGSTNDAGNITLTVDALDANGMTLNGVIPSTNYHAVMDSINVPEKVFLNDVLGGQIRLINTLGQPLEAQDCSVVVLENSSSRVIKDYQTQCYSGEPYVDPTSGNWVSYSKCPFTDSNGNYYFNTIIKEEDGFQTGGYYVLQFTCNAKTNSSVFYVDVPKPADLDKWMEFARRYAGLIVMYALIIIGIILLIYLVRRGVG